MPPRLAQPRKLSRRIRRERRRWVASSPFRNGHDLSLVPLFDKCGPATKATPNRPDFKPTT